MQCRLITPPHAHSALGVAPSSCLPCVACGVQALRAKARELEGQLKHSAGELGKQRTEKEVSRARRLSSNP